MEPKKPIYVDGVDIVGCVRLQDDETSCELGGECKGWENCYYKQLKRKEQELQQAMDNYVQLDLQRVKEYNELVDLHKAKEQECEALQMSENEAGGIIAELKAECKELKEKVKELHQGWIDCDKERNLQEANSEFRQRVINRYEQTLTEIREIAKEDFNHTCWKTYARQLKQILKKVSEVLNDRQETN